MADKIQQARQEGYSDSDIAQYLMSQGQDPAQYGLMEQQSQPPQNTIQNAQDMVQNQQPVDVAGLILKYFPKGQQENAFRIMEAESAGNPEAIGDNYPIDTGNGPETIPSYGLFQIRGLPGRPDPQTLLNPEENVKYAAQLFQQSGWHPWSTAKGLGLD